MKRLTILLAGASLFASQVTAGSVSNVPGTLDTTMVDPAPALYPHFICASGCSGGSSNGAVSQSGAWSVGVSNFPSVQAVSGTVNVGNFPTTQAISGTVSVGTSVGFGGVGSPSAYVESVQGVTGGAPLNVSESDGGDTTLGSKADAASATGSASVVSILKQLHLDSIGSLPPGTNMIGSIGIAASANAFQPQGFSPTAQINLTNNCYSYGSATTLFNLAGYASQANLWILVYNASSAPADGSGTQPVYFYGPLPGSGPWSLAFPTPIALSTGMTLCYSTTGPGTKTSTTGITAGSALEEVHS